MKLLDANSHSQPDNSILGRLFLSCPRRDIVAGEKYVVISDVHMGNGGGSDDFRANARLFLGAIRSYYQRGYTLVLNGDIEELQKFSLESIQKAWKEIFHLFLLFKENGRLIKIFGNHDEKLMYKNHQDLPVQEAQVLRYKNKEIFIFHGHQSKALYVYGNQFVEFLLRYVAQPLRIRNTSVRHDSKKKFQIEQKIYSFSAAQGILSIIGHTHRPLFESMSRLDTVRFEIERLCRKFPKESADQQHELEQRIVSLGRELSMIIESGAHKKTNASLYTSDLLVPCLFNSGTVISRQGLTALEIKRDTIGLVHWFTPQQPHGRRAWQKPPKVDEASGNFRALVKKDSLDYVFSRVSLLGNMGV